jgi:hypothetical protein
VSIAAVVPVDPDGADDHGDISLIENDNYDDYGTILFGQEGYIEDYNVTLDMVFGTPPLPLDDTEDITPHNVFETYFAEYPLLSIPGLKLLFLKPLMSRRLPKNPTGTVPKATR